MLAALHLAGTGKQGKRPVIGKGHVADGDRGIGFDGLWHQRAIARQRGEASTPSFAEAKILRKGRQKAGPSLHGISPPRRPSRCIWSHHAAVPMGILSASISRYCSGRGAPVATGGRVACLCALRFLSAAPASAARPNRVTRQRPTRMRSRVGVDPFLRRYRSCSSSLSLLFFVAIALGFAVLPLLLLVF